MRVHRIVGGATCGTAGDWWCHAWASSSLNLLPNLSPKTTCCSLGFLKRAVCRQPELLHPSFFLFSRRCDAEHSRPRCCCTEWCSESSLRRWETDCYQRWKENGMTVGFYAAQKGAVALLKAHTHKHAHTWELSGLLRSAQPRPCIILPIHVLCTWATVRFVVELPVNDQHQLPEAKQRAASGEADEWTELRPPDDKLNMEALHCLCLHPVLRCVPGNTFHNSMPHTQRGGMNRKKKKKKKSVWEALTTSDVSIHTLFLFAVFMPSTVS